MQKIIVLLLISVLVILMPNHANAELIKDKLGVATHYIDSEGTIIKIIGPEHLYRPGMKYNGETIAETQKRTNGGILTDRISTTKQDLLQSISLSSENVKNGYQESNDTLFLWGQWDGYGNYGDCWGYTDTTTGTEYALICARNSGVAIVDIDVWPPQEVGFIPTLFGSTDAKDVKIYKHYAIIIKESERIQIVDISDPTNPTQVSVIFPAGGSGAHNCIIEGDYLYVVGNHAVGGIEIYNISNPASPVFTGQFQPTYYHDLDIRNDTIYAAAIYGEGVDVIDVSNKSNPQFITNFNYPGSGAHNCELTEDGHYLFVGDEIGTSGNHVRVFDVSDINNVSLVDNIIVNSQAIVHNCYVKGNLLYIAHYTEGLRIWNIDNPENSYEVQFYDTYPQGGVGFSGAWSVYPFFTSGKIIVSDMQTGLYVLKYSAYECADVTDDDSDGIGNFCDNCIDTPNPDQYDENFDGIGDACDGAIHLQAYYIPDGYLGEPYSYQFSSIGGIGPYSYQLLGGDIPFGCTFTGGTVGTITGTPSWNATYFITLEVTDSSVPPLKDTLSTSILITDAPKGELCGDADGSFGVDVSDAVFLINYIFAGGPAPNPLDIGDVDCSGLIDVSDAVYLISFIFSGGSIPCAVCP